MGRKTFFKKTDKLHSFKIVARSQQDPLIADEKAPKSVLVDIKEEEATGVYFDEDYNYLQRLKGVKETVHWQDGEAAEVYCTKVPAQTKHDLPKGLSLPSSVFESHVKEPIGMLNKAAPVSGPQPNLDPDIVACLDDAHLLNEGDDVDEDFDNMISLLNKESLDDSELPLDDDSNVSSGGLSECGSDLSFEYFDPDDFYGTATNKSATGFTEYSLTSVNMPRSEQAEFFNRRYEAFYLKHYAADKREVTEEDAQGFIDAKEAFASVIEPRERRGFAQDFPEEKAWNKRYILATEEQRLQPTKREKEPNKRVLKYDCVTIHEARAKLNPYKPEYIDDPKYKKIRLTKKSLAQHEVTMERAESSDDSDFEGSDQQSQFQGGMTLKSALSLASIRDKKETTEQKRERLNNLRHLRKLRRIEKKETSLLYKECMKAQARTPKQVRFRPIP